MRIAIRTDASPTIGTGHLKRCLSLGRELEAMGASVKYVTRKIDRTSASVLAAEMNVEWLAACADDPSARENPAPHGNWSRVGWHDDALQTIERVQDFVPDWVIVDHYAFDALWHAKVRDSLGCKVMVIDDLADRDLSADLLLDANYASDHALKYRDRVISSTRTCFGPRFALLDETYRSCPPFEFRSGVESIGIFMGGADVGGLSEMALASCREEVGFEGRIEVVSTSGNPNLTRLSEICSAAPNTTLLIDLPNLAGFFSRHDLQIGAGGSASWERCCVGAPSISVTVAANQLAVTPVLDEIGVIVAASLGQGCFNHSDKSIDALGQVLTRLLSDPEKRLELSRKAKALVDGFGARRAAVCLFSGNMKIRPTTIADTEILFRWRNHPSTRNASLNTDELEYGEHLAWIERSLADTANRYLFVAMLGSLPVGSIRFDRIDDLVFEVSLYLDPDLHGLGLGQEMLMAGERKMFVTCKRPFRVDATVLPGNATSATMFARCGYSGAAPKYWKNVSTDQNGLRN